MTPGPSSLTPPPTTSPSTADAAATAATAEANEGPKHCAHCGIAIIEEAAPHPTSFNVQIGAPSPSARAFAPSPPPPPTLAIIICNACRVARNSTTQRRLNVQPTELLEHVHMEHFTSHSAGVSEAAVPWRHESVWQSPHTNSGEANMVSTSQATILQASTTSSSSSSTPTASANVHLPSHHTVSTTNDFPPLSYARSASPTSPRPRIEARFGMHNSNHSSASSTHAHSASSSSNPTVAIDDDNNGESSVGERDSRRHSSFSRSTISYPHTTSSSAPGVVVPRLSSDHPGVPLPQVSFSRVVSRSSHSTTSGGLEDALGPSAMTRPRLSTLPLSSSNVVHHPSPTQVHVATLEWRALATAPDPRTDITRLRCTSKGKGCLFPGATFVGTQKSGRSCYEVGVKIVNVDLEASHLCGYLNIRGLTEDWPELTTFFDAEIIGLRYSFVTGKWGAKESNDMTHWSRFAPFRPLRNRLGKSAHFNHLNRPYIFMRWKERFLVPDHRVRDINGASFAGFYYVCVELGDVPSPSSSSSTPSNAVSSSNTASSSHRRTNRFPTSSASASLDEDTSAELASLHPSAAAAAAAASASAAAQAGDLEDVQMMDASASSYLSTSASASAGVASLGPATLDGTTSRAAETSSRGALQTSSNLASFIDPAAVHSTSPLTGTGGASISAAGGTTAGRMTGFYFHENSEPYQQLSLHHVPETSSSTFEMR